MQARVTRTRTTSLLFECVGVWSLPSCSAAAAREPWHARDMQVRRCSVRPSIRRWESGSLERSGTVRRLVCSLWWDDGRAELSCVGEGGGGWLTRREIH